MSSAGSIMDMIIKLRNNAGLLKKKRYFENYDENVKTNTEIPHLKTKATKEQLKAIRKQARANKKRNTNEMIIAFLLSLGITIFFFVKFISLL